MRDSSRGSKGWEPRDAEFVYNEYDGHLEHLIAVYLFDETSTPPPPLRP